MPTEKTFQALKTENELLQLQVEDLNEMIRRRETELANLNGTVRYAIDLQSRLDQNLYEFEQMQRTIGSKQQQLAGSEVRLEELEGELLVSIQTERKYTDIVKAHQSLQADYADTAQELEQAAALYKKVQQLKAALAAATSELEMCRIENQQLREELEESTRLNALLRASKFK